MNIRTVTVIGAGGTMGCNISAIFASFGAAKVYMVDVERPINAIDRAIASVRSESIRKNLVPADFSMLEKCVSESDLIFESVVERIDVKKSVAEKCAPYIKEGAFLCTGTSGLSITEIANSLPEKVRSKYFGMHFFNPPYNMPLCEIIKTNYSLDEDIAFICDYLKKVLFRTVVVCKDKPAFLANRIGFYFINRALQLAQENKEFGGLDYIDSIFGQFTGRLMAPCNTADFVGLDIHKAIVDNVLHNTNDYSHDSFVLPQFVQELISEGKMGRKTKEGLFKLQINDDGTKLPLVYDIKTKEYRIKNKNRFMFAEKMKMYLQNGDYELAFNALIVDDSREAQICKNLLQEYIEYSIFVGKEVCDDISYIDDAMATGFNWCPPLALSNVLFKTNYPTKYDYRSFFRAGK